MMISSECALIFFSLSSLPSPTPFLLNKKNNLKEKVEHLEKKLAAALVPQQVSFGSGEA